tara:strand:+ start:335 stop:550 length:216 start_codon:yes stop_codon:yes gene_type:complete
MLFEFIKIKTIEGNLVAVFREERQITLHLNESTLRERIANLKHYGMDTSVEEYALQEMMRQYNLIENETNG